MHDSTDPRRPGNPPRVRLVAAAAAVIGVLVAGCGGGSSSPPVAAVRNTPTSPSSTASTATTTISRSGPATSLRSHTTTSSTSRTTTGGGATNSSSRATGGLQPQELAYSECMRANGVPSFPDPKPGGGFNILMQRGSKGGAGIDPSSPLYKAANAKCQKLLPNGGAGPTYSAQAGVRLLTIAKCMRQHGIPGFPDPQRAQTGSLPPPKPGIGRITNYMGWLLEFPATINMQSPAYTHAAAACDARFLNEPQ